MGGKRFFRRATVPGALTTRGEGPFQYVRDEESSVGARRLGGDCLAGAPEPRWDMFTRSSKRKLSMKGGRKRKNGKKESRAPFKKNFFSLWLTQPRKVASHIYTPALLRQPSMSTVGPEA